ncbi:MAG: shikimate dehydrogenase [Candidatus Methanomethylophilaceae archaeon]|nr:shikimate dehydrogenase [Candidatus Methanomethylophilaceae archaeon]
MRICSTYRSSSDYDGRKGCREYRLDAFDSLPDTNTDTIITLCGEDISLVPDGFTGLVDVGDADIQIPFRKIVSHHDFDRTPSASGIVSMLDSESAEIVKGAFAVHSFKDLISILDASKRMDRKHVILGMGETGTVTRLRQGILRNEFTFGYVGESTAPGQLSADEMESLGDDCTIVGVTGIPLAHSLSPKMQNAAIKASGINAIFLKFQSDTVEGLYDTIVGYDIRGMNVTIPHKSAVIEQMDSLSKTAEAIGAVNTIINDDGTLIGDNTDSKGVRYAFKDNVPDIGSKVLIMGSGGAARAATHAMLEMGCEVTVSGRNPETVRSIANTFSVTGVQSARMSDYGIVINCTPIGMDATGTYPAEMDIGEDQVIFDAVYNRATPLVELAHRIGCTVLDGKDMLIGQGAESFRLWFRKEAPIESMREALE